MPVLRREKVLTAAIAPQDMRIKPQSKTKIHMLEKIIIAISKPYGNIKAWWRDKFLMVRKGLRAEGQPGRPSLPKDL